MVQVMGQGGRMHMVGMVGKGLRQGMVTTAPSSSRVLDMVLAVVLLRLVVVLREEGMVGLRHSSNRISMGAMVQGLATGHREVVTTRVQDIRVMGSRVGLQLLRVVVVVLVQGMLQVVQGEGMGKGLQGAMGSSKGPLLLAGVTGSRLQGMGRKVVPLVGMGLLVLQQLAMELKLGLGLRVLVVMAVMVHRGLLLAGRGLRVQGMVLRLQVVMGLRVGMLQVKGRLLVTQGQRQGRLGVTQGRQQGQLGLLGVMEVLQLEGMVHRQLAMALR